MKFTCLSKGEGFYFPPCHMLNICGFRVLLDCPIDLSALTIFSPIPIDYDGEVSNYSAQNSNSADGKSNRVEKPLEASDLIRAVPWYKTVKSLHLWDVSFIDIVLISSPMGMLGLPFLTQLKKFSAKIYATEATVRLGKLMMEDLVSMHAEFRQFYGPEENGFPQWLKWEELEMLPSALRVIAMGEDGAELGSWKPLYSAAHVKECIQKIQSLKYAEEVYHNGTLVIKAFSSGLEIGASNWVINGPKRNFTWLSSSIFASRHAMGFDYNSLQGNGVILFSDFSSTCGNVSVDIDAYRSMNQIRPKVNSPTGSDFSTLRDGNNSKEDFIKSVTDTGENTVEIDKLAFICSCAIDSVKEGGSVLIPIGRLGIILQLLEQISISLESSNLNVPMFIISDVAEEILSLMNVVPEWLCEQRQQKLYSGEALFGHVKLIKEKKLHLFRTIHSPNLLAIWMEPCIVFSPHWSLRQGPAIHLLRRWSADKRCLLVLEQGVDADIALLPFKPIAMKVLQCSFLSGIEMQKIQPLLEILRPKLILFPEDLMAHMITSHTGSSVYFGYSENETICVPRSRDEFEVDLATDLVFQLQPRRIKQENAAIARLKGKYLVHHGRHLLTSENEPVNHSQSRLLLQWGSLDLTLLLLALREKGINGSIDNDGMGEHNACFLRIYEPKKALIETTGTLTVVSAVDETLASIIFQTICSVLDAI